MKHVSESIAAYLGGELPAAAAERMDQHLRACSECRRELEGARGVWELLGLAAEAVPPAGVQERSAWPAIQARTFGSAEVWGAWFFGRGPLTRAGWAAAAVVAGVMLGALLPPGPPAGENGNTPLAVNQDPSWLEASWLDSSTTGAVLADQWLLAGLDEQENGS